MTKAETVIDILQHSPFGKVSSVRLAMPSTPLGLYSLLFLLGDPVEH